jgi:predicted nuclease of restriction endonuclease-like (RecB) superfamily
MNIAIETIKFKNFTPCQFLLKTEESSPPLMIMWLRFFRYAQNEPNKIIAKQVIDNPLRLFQDVCKLIDSAKSRVASAANFEMTLLYWQIGERVNKDLLDGQRADYGKQIVTQLATQLQKVYGTKGFEARSIRRMMRFAMLFPDSQIVSQAATQLSWSHLKTIIYLKDDLQRQFYMEMCILERWSTRKLSGKINSMVYERTTISKKPGQLIKQEIKELREDVKLTLDPVFRDPYFLNLLDLKNTFNEKKLEDAILGDLGNFIMEIAQGFSIVERQKRIVIYAS